MAAGYGRELGFDSDIEEMGSQSLTIPITADQLSGETVVLSAACHSNRTMSTPSDTKSGSWSLVSSNNPGHKVATWVRTSGALLLTGDTVTLPSMGILSGYVAGSVNALTGVGTSAAVNEANNGTSATIAVPIDTVSTTGVVIVAWIHATNVGGVTESSGYTAARNESSVGGGVHFHVAYKVTVAATNDYSATHDTSAAFVATADEFGESATGGRAATLPSLGVMAA